MKTELFLCHKIGNKVDEIVSILVKQKRNNAKDNLVIEVTESLQKIFLMKRNPSTQ